MTTHMVTDPDAIRDVLACDLAVPPHRPGDGAALELRAAMARFAVPAEHGPRRASVEEVLAELDVTEVRELAGRAAEDEFVLIGDAVELGRMVPVRVLLAALGLVPIDDAAAGEAAGADVDAIAAVIGRGAEPNAAADAAAERLLALAGARGRDPVAVVSVLYQCLDAVAALITTTLHARARGAARVAAVQRTMRVAVEPFDVGGLPVAAGDVLELAIGEAGLEFGAGPHACPGRQLAEAIAAEVVAAIEALP